MNNLWRRALAIAFAGVLVACAALPSAAARRSAFDGTWSVIIYTRKGDCDPTSRYPVRIEGGRVVTSGSEDYQVRGGIKRDGSITVTLIRGDQSAHGSGRLAGNVGRGWWRTSRGQCSGVWTAERRSEY